MNQKQKKYYDDKLNQYEFIQYNGPRLYFYHNASRSSEDRTLDADRSLPLLRRKRVICRVENSLVKNEFFLLRFMSIRNSYD